MTVVGVLGISHDPAIRARCHFPLTMVEELLHGFSPDVVCGEVEPRSFRLYQDTGNPRGILGETQDEYPRLIYPYCEARGIPFVPVDWFEEDVFREGPFDRCDGTKQRRLQEVLEGFQERQLATGDQGGLPLNSDAYDAVTAALYAWLDEVAPTVQAVQWNARHHIMLARLDGAIRGYAGKRILCIHGADHNYWLRAHLGRRADVELVFPLRR